MTRMFLALALVGISVAAASPVGDVPSTAVPTTDLEVPRVGTRAEFDRLIHEYETVEGRVHATHKPASWVQVEVGFRTGGDGQAAEVWADEPGLYYVREARLVAASDTFITPGELRRFREAAEEAVRSSRFALLDAVDGKADDSRSRVTFYWRFGARGTVDLYSISGQFRRDGGVLLDETGESPVVVLLGGPTRTYRARFSRDQDNEALLAARGIPADRIVTGDSERCGIFGELPEGLVRGEAADVKPVVIEESLVRPSYPEQARIWRTGGTVKLDVVLDEEGVVVGVVLKRAAPGFPSFARSVVDAVCASRYMPATQAGVPVPAVVESTSEFELR